MKILLFCFFVIFLPLNLHSQIRINLDDSRKLSLANTGSKLLNNQSSASDKMLGSFTYLAITALVINPILILENKKIYFGLTKEISAGKFPFGRIAFEYSFIFRDSLKSHLRLSYNYDFALMTSDFVASLLSPGAGYFTDTKNKGWFGQASLSIIFAAVENVLFMPYLRYRFTYIQNKSPEKTNIHDVSLGVGLVFYY